MKTCGWVELQPQSFFTSASGRLHAPEFHPPGERAHGPNWIGGCVDHTVFLDTLGKKFPSHVENWTPIPRRSTPGLGTIPNELSKHFGYFNINFYYLLNLGIKFNK
jgi:hypothetical protein